MGGAESAAAESVGEPSPVVSRGRPRGRPRGTGRGGGKAGAKAGGHESGTTGDGEETTVRKRVRRQYPAFELSDIPNTVLLPNFTQQDIETIEHSADVFDAKLKHSKVLRVSLILKTCRNFFFTVINLINL